MSQAWPFTKADQWHAGCMPLFCAMISKMGLFGKGVTCGLNTSSALRYGQVKAKLLRKDAQYKKLFVFVSD